jgi:photosynthetic reaction center cytochrome c subunit
MKNDLSRVHRSFARSFATIAPAIFAVAITTQTAFAQAAHDGPAPPPAGKNAEEIYKNIIQLKGTPADQLGGAMAFISASLGVECSFCHVPGKFELDDKPAKKTAREMMAMQASINKASFNGRTQVTCYSCHRGSERPVAVPPALESDLPASTGAKATPAAGVTTAGAAPTADDIVAKYVAAVGGADAMKKITDRVERGQILVGNSKTPIEVFTKAPNKRVSITHNGDSDSYTAFDGAIGWLGSTGRPAHEMSVAEAGAASLDAEFYLPLRIKEIFPQLRRGRPETIDGVECEVLNGSGPGRPATRLYFDKKTGLLTRMVRFAETPLGRIPTQIDYADYRDADGVKIPFRWTLARVNGRFTIQIEGAKSNLGLEDAKFAEPAGPVKDSRTQ